MLRTGEVGSGRKRVEDEDAEASPCSLPSRRCSGGKTFSRKRLLTWNQPEFTRQEPPVYLLTLVQSFCKYLNLPHFDVNKCFLNYLSFFLCGYQLLIREIITEMLFLICSFILHSFVEVFPAASIYDGRGLKVTDSSNIYPQFWCRPEGGALRSSSSSLQHIVKMRFKVCISSSAALFSCIHIWGSRRSSGRGQSVRSWPIRCFSWFSSTSGKHVSEWPSVRRGPPLTSSSRVCPVFTAAQFSL